MDMVIPVGTLVRVLDKALSSTTGYVALNRGMVTKHGWLYFVVSHDKAANTYLCKSLATGVDGLPWRSDEIEAAEEQADG